MLHFYNVAQMSKCISEIVHWVDNDSTMSFVKVSLITERLKILMKCNMFTLKNLSKMCLLYKLEAYTLALKCGITFQIFLQNGMLKQFMFYISYLWMCL